MAALRRTALFDFHVARGAKMVPFAGWEMPVQYKESIINSHLHTREKAGLFDVSHMLGVRFTGKDRAEFVEKMCPADVTNLPPSMGTLSVLTNEAGGIIDDCIVTNRGDDIYTVINAGHEDKDLPHLEKHMKAFVSGGKEVKMEPLTGNALLALQGPKAVDVMKKLSGHNFDAMKFMSGSHMKVAGVDCFVTRSGYTGEDGFEIAFKKEASESIASEICKNTDVMTIGRGARDSLRLEAGLCLYGNDLDDTTTPVEAGLMFVIAKARRANGGFVGDDVILKQITEKSAARKRIGLVIPQGAPARNGAEVLDMDGNNIGTITSGVHSPCLKQNISMAYVKTPFSKSGTELMVKVRGKTNKAVVTKMPFVPSNYYRGA
jgi:aminomethyltransferase